MKPSRCLPTILAAACLLCGKAPQAHGQDTKPAKPAAAMEVVPLGKAAEKLTQLEEELAKMLEQTRAVVDAEAAAKRITDPVAQSLRWSLRISATSSDLRTLLSSTRVPSDNAALAQSFKELETAATLLQTRRNALISGVGKELRRQVGEAVRGTPTAAEIVALTEQVEQAQEALQMRLGNSGETQVPWQNATNVLRFLRRLIEAEGSQNLATLSSAVSAFRSTTQNSREVLGEGDGQTRLARIFQPAAKATEEKQAALDAAIEARKPSPELTTALTAFAEATDRQYALRDNQYGSSSDSRNTVSTYRAIVTALKAVETGDGPQAQDRLREATGSLQQLGAVRAAKFEPVLGKLDKELVEKAAKIHQQRIADLRARLVAVQQPADMDALAAEIQTWSLQARNRGGEEREDFSQLIQQLSMLSAAWASASPALLHQERGGGAVLSGSFAREFAALRSRIERDVIARVLKAPELNTPPLADKAPEAALDALCDDLAQRGEWRRLLQILQARPQTQFQPYGRGVEDETVSALRAFFAAQNLELAEQWADAAQAYKTVLRGTGERIPIKAAADRLKVLAKEHPDAVATPARESAPPLPRLPTAAPEN